MNNYPQTKWRTNMEKLINILLGISNWYENTTVRAHDPIEIADLKVCERRVVGAFILAIFFAGLSAFVAAKIPSQGDVFALVLAPALSYISKGLALACLATTIGCLYYAGRGIYHYIHINR